MKSTLTLIDRYVIEAINKRQIDLISLNQETGIEIRVLQKVLSILESLELVLCHQNQYSVHLKNLKVYSKSKKFEVMNIMKEISFNSKQVSIKKVYLSKSDDLRVQSMFQDIENFIESRSSKHKSVKSKTLLYWGQQNYGELINNYIN